MVTGEYRELVPDRRIVVTRIHEGPIAAAGKMEALLTVEFGAAVPGTEIRLRHEGLTSPHYREVIRRGA